MLDNTGALMVSSRHYPSIAMLVVGAGLLAGTFWGRSRGLVFLGLLIAPFALTASVVRVPWETGAGERFLAPSTVEDTTGGFHLIAGSMSIDLSHMDWSRPVDIEARMGFGEILVSVPADVRVDVDGHVGAGSIMLFGKERSGTDIDFDTVNLGTRDGGGDLADRTLTLDLEASFGRVVVARGQSPGLGGTDTTIDGGTP